MSAGGQWTWSTILVGGQCSRRRLHFGLVLGPLEPRADGQHNDARIGLLLILLLLLLLLSELLLFVLLGHRQTGPVWSSRRQGSPLQGHPNPLILLMLVVQRSASLVAANRVALCPVKVGGTVWFYIAPSSSSSLKRKSSISYLENACSQPA